MTLTFDEPSTCRWCLDAPATTIIYATPACLPCAASGPRERVTRWLSGVARRIRESD